LVLLDIEFYRSRLLPLLARWMLLVLRSMGVAAPLRSRRRHTQIAASRAGASRAGAGQEGTKEEDRDDQDEEEKGEVEEEDDLFYSYLVHGWDDPRLRARINAHFRPSAAASPSPSASAAASPSASASAPAVAASTWQQQQLEGQQQQQQAAAHEHEHVALLNLVHDWLHSYVAITRTSLTLMMGSSCSRSSSRRTGLYKQ
jgi:hypothetical protein